MPALDRKWWTLIAVCTATFMLLLDITVVNVALPDIQSSLHASFSDLQWVVDAYSLTLAAFLLTAGVAGDIYGRRKIFAIGLVVFSLASLVCGLSTTPLMLNLARAVQGVGGAIMFATSLALIAAAFTGRDRGTAFGIYGAVIGGAVAIGPLIGGAITSGIGWRWIFFVNVPIGAIAVLITFTQIAKSEDLRARKIDWVGFVTFSVSLFLLVFALVRGNDFGWGSATTIGLLAGAAVLMVGFFVNERFAADPMLDLGLFKIPAFVGLSTVAFCLAASIFAMFLYLTLYIQDDLGYGPLAAGVRFLPMTLLIFFTLLLCRASDRAHALAIPAGHRHALRDRGAPPHGDDPPEFDLDGAPARFPGQGFGVGIVNPVLASGAVSVVQPQRSGMASGANNTFRQVGIATGIAVLGAVFQSQIVAHTTAALNKSPFGPEMLRQGGAQLQGAMASGEVRQAAAAIPVPAPARRCSAPTTRGSPCTLNHLMYIGAVVALVGAICGFALVRQRDFVIPTGAPSGPPAQGGQGQPRRRRTMPSPLCMREPFTLEGRFVRLEPLTEAHIPALVEAAALDRSTYQWTYTPDGVEQMTDYVRDALVKVASQAHVAFATVRRGAGPDGSDLVVGATRFCELAFWQWPPGASHQRHGVPDVVDIGYTWLAGPAQRTHVNTEAKLLMMTHAFEVWEVHRVALQTDVRNTRSRAAIERIGGQLDGIMRADRPGSDDTVRTSARFSIVAAEWPEVKERLTARLALP